MPVWRYMELCLTHPRHGYYVSRDPLGREGDFTTVEQFGKLKDFIARVNGAAADEDHRRFAAGDQRGGGLDPLRIGLRCGEQIERLCCGHVGALREHVP